MKNVILVSSFLMNVFGLSFFAYEYGFFRKAPQETTATETKAPIPEVNPAKVLLKEAMLKRTEIESCYDQYLRKEPTRASGYVLVKWTMGPGGQVMEPLVADTEIQDEDLSRCVIEEVARMTFDSEHFTEHSQVSYRFHFKARSPSSIQFE